MFLLYRPKPWHCQPIPLVSTLTVSKNKDCARREANDDEMVLRGSFDGLQESLQARKKSALADYWRQARFWVRCRNLEWKRSQGYRDGFLLTRICSGRER